MKRYQLLQEKRENIIKIARKHGAFNILIFGSVARGEDSNDSDIDFLVEMEQGRNLLDRIGLIQDLEDYLGCKVDVATINSLRDCFREYTQEGKDRFYQSLLIQDAVIRCFEVIGEAVKQLSPEIRKKYPEITWRKIAGFREK